MTLRCSCGAVRPWDMPPPPPAPELGPNVTQQSALATLIHYPHLDPRHRAKLHLEGFSRIEPKTLFRTSSLTPSLTHSIISLITDRTRKQSRSIGFASDPRIPLRDGVNVALSFTSFCKWNYKLAL
ncbi:hypothetical protein AAFF_G00233950 [Aldrovandia affinis]|uniref:Uncharacterized protein n=1 Tax=Aldrovandia affinis TaxID=143900 RepID=A0AAD7REH9_9TELE|nr:hypothetical protein AAFF_G00233950 [Aldrovandia affinis]